MFRFKKKENNFGQKTIEALLRDNRDRIIASYEKNLPKEEYETDVEKDKNMLK